jgi:hypothetical protein
MADALSPKHQEKNAMQTALRLQTTVLPGRRIEVTDPELPEGSKVELIILLPPETSAPPGRYPAAVEAEYNTLLQKKFARTLTAEEALRLQAVRDEMSAIDRNAPDMQALQAQKLREELAHIRAELDALPDAGAPQP